MYLLSSPTFCLKIEFFVALRITGPAVTVAPIISKRPLETVRPPVAQSSAHKTPMTLSSSTLLSEINVLPSPFVSINMAASESLGYSTPLTEKVLRSRRRDALCAAADVVSSALLPTYNRSYATRYDVFPIEMHYLHSWVLFLQHGNMMTSIQL